LRNNALKRFHMRGRMVQLSRLERLEKELGMQDEKLD
jgi:hypothetical protein